MFFWLLFTDNGIWPVCQYRSDQEAHWVFKYMTGGQQPLIWFRRQWSLKRQGSQKERLLLLWARCSRGNEETEKERKTVGGIVNSSSLIRERSRSHQWQHKEERVDGLWIIICRGGHWKNHERREQELPSAISLLHSTLLIWVWNKTSPEPSSLSRLLLPSLQYHFHSYYLQDQ